MRNILASVVSLVVIGIASIAFIPTVSAEVDSDGDGIPDFQEAILGTNPYLWTNTDGILYTEASVNPGTITSGDTTQVTLTIATNTTQGPSDNVTVTYVMPEGVEYQIGSAVVCHATSDCNSIEPNIIVDSTTILEWRIPNLPVVSPWNVTFEVKPLNTGNSGKVQLSVFPDSGVTYKYVETTGGGLAMNCVFASPSDSNKHANFGFVAQTKKGGGTSGHMTFHDHGEDKKLQSDTITELSVVGNTATFKGDVSVNGISGYSFEVYVEDNAEPGVGNDRFKISIYDPSNNLCYTTGEIPVVLQGGNIQIHNTDKTAGGGFVNSVFINTHLPFPELAVTMLVNLPPVASFTVSNDTPTTNEPVTFDASESYDPDGHIDIFKWNFDGDSVWDIEGNVATITHSYSTNGTYSVTLEVVDNLGATDGITKTIVVGDGTGGMISGNVTWNGTHSFAGLGGRMVIGKPRSINATAYNIRNNVDAALSVTVELRVDGVVLNSATETIPAHENRNIPVSGTWVPMSSGMHHISLHAYDGEYWVPPTNDPTVGVEVRIEKVK